jgi:hypothetical protein
VTTDRELILRAAARRLDRVGPDYAELARALTSRPALGRRPSPDSVLAAHIVDAYAFRVSVCGRDVSRRVHAAIDVWRDDTGKRPTFAIEIVDDLVDLESAIVTHRELVELVRRTTASSGVPELLEDPSIATQVADALRS